MSAGRPTTGFPPIADGRASVLVLGSLPSRRSVRERQYYAHPQNAFWRIMDCLVGAGPALPYPERVRRLTGAGIAVWDVLASSVRPGSMDADIDEATAVPNEFGRFLATHRRIRRVCFNGRKAADMFRRIVLPAEDAPWPVLEYRTLPSTSPAYASMRFEDKLAAWKAGLGPARAGTPDERPPAICG